MGIISHAYTPAVFKRLPHNIWRTCPVSTASRSMPSDPSLVTSSTRALHRRQGASCRETTGTVTSLLHGCMQKDMSRTRVEDVAPHGPRGCSPPLTAGGGSAAAGGTTETCRLTSAVELTGSGGSATEGSTVGKLGAS